MSTYEYEVTPENGVKGFVVLEDGTRQVLVNQPKWASGEAFSAEQAAAYGVAWVASFADDATELPGDSPEEPTVAKPAVAAEVVEETLAITAAE